MSYSPYQASSVTHTRLRDPKHVCDISGMCAICTGDCIGPCEIGLSAIRGTEALYPYASDRNQFASEKIYPVDFSHFNINGRVFGVEGSPFDRYEATFPKVDISSYFGLVNPVDISSPVILPAMAKLAWKEYYTGAALSGIPVVIGEAVITKDPGLVVENGRVKSSPLLQEMVDTYRRFYRGKGDIVLQANADDERLGVLEYAIEELGFTSVELKLGQAAKGIQGMGNIPDREKAVHLKHLGYIITPDPEDPKVIENFSKGIGPVFLRVDSLPLWTPEYLTQRIEELRNAGAQRVCLKTGPFDPRDIETILKIASQSHIDLVTLDGAGGGTGHSPVKMMNEWGMPTVTLEVIVHRILEKFEREGIPLPPVAIAGGFASEDQVFKGLALGAPYVSLIAIGRSAMAAATVGRQVGLALKNGKLPEMYSSYGCTVEEVFADYRLLKGEYGSETDKIPTGAIGLYSYMNRISTGLKQLMALNRKFSLSHITREDIIPLTSAAADMTGLPTYIDILKG